MSWLSFNDSLNQIKGQITNFATGVLNEAILQEQEEEGSKTNEDSGSLQEINHEAEVRHETYGTKTEEGLRKRIEELEKEKAELVVSLEQLDLDCQRTTENLLVLRDELRTDYDALKVRHEKLELEHVDCAKNTNGQKNFEQIREENEKLRAKVDSLEEKLCEFEVATRENTAVLREDEELKLQNRKLEEENSKLKEKSSDLVFELKGANESLIKQLKEVQFLNDEFKRKEESLKADFENVSKNNETVREKIELEKQILHETYVKILTENAQKYMESKKDEEMLLVLPQGELVAEFGQKVENLLKLFLYLKTKTESLENELYEVTEEKNNSILEKNFEIEKLLKNSEILSQEVITKSLIIKDCEAECAELMKNNDALIADLKTYQNNGGLQTISESNEDNLLLLESELLNANQKIKDLEITISDIDNSNQETNLEAQTEVDYIKMQLNLTGQELNRSKEDCHELSLRYKKLQEEDSELKFTLEKLRSDYENVEYKCEEAKVNLEALFEENQFYKLEIDKLDGLEKQNKKFAAEIELFKQLVEKLKVESKESEMVAKNSVEKLQNSKMNETKLKLQIDTLCKEAQVLKESNKVLEDGNKSFKEVETDVVRAREDLLESGRKNKNLIESNQNLRTDLERTKSELSKMSSEFLTLKWQVENSSGENVKKEGEEESFRYENVELQNRVKVLEGQVGEAVKSRDEIIALVKVKHEESDRYYKEIQRLTQLLNVETEKSEKVNKLYMEVKQNFTDDRIVLERAVNEKTAAIEKEQSVGKELERLRVHLVDIEETYTRELMDAEQNNKEMQEKLNDIVKREKDSSSIYTSVSIRANQQVETLQKQLQLVTNQRDELNIKLSNYEDQNNKQIAALTNLQLVLDQFQKDKEKDVTRETERIRRQIGIEKNVQESLRKEISSLKSQLEESKQGLQAASRLADQLEKCQLQILNFKEQEKKLLEQLKKSESVCKELSTQTDAKVDKTLMKNLMLGYVGSNSNEERNQTLKIISTVLDFNRDESDRVNLNKQEGGGWLKSLMQPQTMPNREFNSHESLSQAFVRFMEKESKPVELPNLLPSNERERRVSESGMAPRKSRPLLSEIVLPTFGEFERSRNSGSILKDVLKDNS